MFILITATYCCGVAWTRLDAGWTCISRRRWWLQRQRYATPRRRRENWFICTWSCDVRTCLNLVPALAARDTLSASVICRLNDANLQQLHLYPVQFNTSDAWNTSRS